MQPELRSRRLDFLLPVWNNFATHVTDSRLETFCESDSNPNFLTQNSEALLFLTDFSPFTVPSPLSKAPYFPKHVQGSRSTSNIDFREDVAHLTHKQPQVKTCREGLWDSRNRAALTPHQNFFRLWLLTLQNLSDSWTLKSFFLSDSFPLGVIYLIKYFWTNLKVNKSIVKTVNRSYELVNSKIDIFLNISFY